MAFQRNLLPIGNRLEYRKFVQADVEENHNKYWNVGLYDSGDVEIEFGRIGVTQTKGTDPNKGRTFMDKKIKAKLRGKTKNGKREYYKEIQTLESTKTSSSGKSIKARAITSITRVIIAITGE
ncbi:unnamed protein product [marine sediment metagenome]|uniref:WGR domain-containing protein n=1 Tax=marine sediment metagenome TaxID=412755 RepID=X0Z954_9ZZZZ